MFFSSLFSWSCWFCFFAFLFLVDGGKTERQLEIAPWPHQHLDHDATLYSDWYSPLRYFKPQQTMRNHQKGIKFIPEHFLFF
jgi:hypothetical protein